jgi:hypothetical protein
MSASEAPHLEPPPISISCNICGKEMKQRSIDTTAESTVYAYRCDNGHRREFATYEWTGPSGAQIIHVRWPTRSDL